jgi:hypothetical protein
LSPKSSGAAQAGVRRSFDDRRTGTTDDTTRDTPKSQSFATPLPSTTTFSGLTYA